MAKNNKKIESEITKIAKKLNIFTIQDIEVLLEKPAIEIIPIVESLVKQKIIKKDNNSYIYIQAENIFPLQQTETKPTKQKYNYNREYKDRLPLKTLPFKPEKPKEIYFRHINEMEGFKEYFFSPQPRKDYVKNIMRILKAAHNLRGKKLENFLKENNMTVSKYKKLKLDIALRGLRPLLNKKLNPQEPAEIYYFFKEYYLSPVRLSAKDSRELAIQRFERLTNMNICRDHIRQSKYMLAILQTEYSKEDIEKYRNPNFSEFDVENMFHE
ncbi:hypothetical protein IJ579_05630 [bacterium]|nr:hypothetical protein [bacterium]